jgi:glucokinase
LPCPSGTLAVIGPGTGLGVAGVVQTPRGWQALPGEGGHATLAATDDFESEVLSQVRRRFDHVSAERVLSGIGLPVLHEAVAAVLGQSLATPFASTTLTLTARDIVEAAQSGGDAVSERTIDTFCALLGSFAGSVALTLGARSGVYIGGGIVPRLGALFEQSRFRQKFEAKGRFRAYLETVPTVLITDTLAALTGSAFALEQAS